MVASHRHTLISQGLMLYRAILASSPTENGSDFLQQWTAYQHAVQTATSVQTLDSHAASAVFIIASNIATVAASRSTLEQECENGVSELSEKMQALATADHGTSSKRLALQEADRCRSSKRTCRPTATKYLPSPSPPLSTTQTAESLIANPNTGTTKQDPIRQYFLSHLSYPYPTASEKESLCKKAGITRRKLESDLTNWRRRSDWTEIMNTYCGGDKGAMKTMILAIQKGEEEDEDLLERYGRMRAYLEKRDEQAGEWVFELAQLVESGQIDQLRFNNRSKRINPNSYDDESSDEVRPDNYTQDADEEEDAEGESDDGVDDQNQAMIGFRYQPALIPTPASKSRAGEEGLPFTTTPLYAIAGSESPLTEISPVSSTGSYHTGSLPSATLTYPQPQAQQVQYHPAPPPAELKAYSTPYIPKGHASNKSSYSSLSAVSSLAGPRKRNISDSSNSTNLRSISGSSTSSYPLLDIEKQYVKRTAGNESHMRSSRSRVEEVLNDHSTSADWVEGHAPSGGFHIGTDPRHIPYPNIEPPPYQYETQYHTQPT